MPIDESPGEDVKIGTSYLAAVGDPALLGERRLLVHELAEVVVQLRRGDQAAEVLRRLLERLAHERVGVEERVLGDEDVVDALDAGLVQLLVVHVEVSLDDRQLQREVEVVVQVRARRDDEVDEAGLDHRLDRAAHPRGRHRARHGERDRRARIDHPAEQIAALREPAAVEGAGAAIHVDEILDRHPGPEPHRLDGWAREVVLAENLRRTWPWRPRTLAAAQERQGAVDRREGAAPRARRAPAEFGGERAAAGRDAIWSWTSPIWPSSAGLNASSSSFA